MEIRFRHDTAQIVGIQNWEYYSQGCRLLRIAAVPWKPRLPLSLEALCVGFDCAGYFDDFLGLVLSWRLIKLGIWKMSFWGAWRRVNLFGRNVDLRDFKNAADT